MWRGFEGGAGPRDQAAAVLADRDGAADHQRGRDDGEPGVGFTGFHRLERDQWQDGLQPDSRNLFGFEDGTANVKAEDPDGLRERVWVAPGDGPDWLRGGSTW